jgi:hypothetical protein
MEKPKVLSPDVFVDTLISRSACGDLADEQRQSILNALKEYNTFKARFLLFCATKNIQNPDGILENINGCFYMPHLTHTTNSNNVSDEDIIYAHSRMFDRVHSKRIGFIQGVLPLIDALYIELYLNQFYGIKPKLFNSLSKKVNAKKKTAAYYLEAFHAIKPYYPQGPEASA